MRTWALTVTWALTLLVILALAGCPPPAVVTRERPSYREEPPLGVPPSYYNHDRSLKHWYTPPYFDPYVAGP
jgi:hypothetical protein